MCAWIKKDSTVEVSGEMEFSSDAITESNAYEAKITEAYLQNSQTAGSKSVSLVISVATEDGETAKSYFTIMGKDGETFFISTVKGKKVKKQHFGLNIVNSLFGIALDKEIFDCEPSETTYKKWNKEDKEMEELTGDGFPELVGKGVGVCVQMIRELKGSNSREYPELKHFFDAESGLFNGEEEPEGKNKTKLNKWLASKKDFQIVEKKETNKSSYGGKKKNADDEEDAPKKKSKWGR